MIKLIFLSAVAFVVVTGSIMRRGRLRSERNAARRELAAIAPLSDTTPDGAVARVTGIVRALIPPLVSPIAGLRCVAYRARCEGRSVTSLDSVHEMRISPFQVGDVVIDSEHARFDLRLQPLEASRQQTDRYDAFLGRYGRTRHEFVGGAVFDEVVVAPDARVTVVGLVMHEPRTISPGEELGFRDQPAPGIRLVGNKDHPIVIGEPID